MRFFFNSCSLTHAAVIVNIHILIWAISLDRYIIDFLVMECI